VTLEELERVRALLDARASFEVGYAAGGGPKEHSLGVILVAYRVNLEQYQRGLRLHEEGQLEALTVLKRVEALLLAAHDSLTPNTEYLRDDLTQQLNGLGLLLQKMEQEEHLRRDRDALLSAVPDSLDQGVGTWITGKDTD
jgi:hypothetical protein